MYNTHMTNYVRKALNRHGITPAQARDKGMPYQSVYRQYYGTRRPSGDFALLYEKLLGISRSELRPDLWPPELWPYPPVVEEKQKEASHDTDTI